MAKVKRIGGFPASVYGTTTLGSRGQLVVPAKARRALKLKPGDKMVVFVNHGKVLGLIKTASIDSFLSHLTQELGRFKS